MQRKKFDLVGARPYFFSCFSRFARMRAWLFSQHGRISWLYRHRQMQLEMPHEIQQLVKGHIAIALSIMAIAGGGLVNLPAVAILEGAFYKVVYKFVASVALKLMWLALAMELLALIIAPSLIAII